jgi:hypothetical protein
MFVCLLDDVLEKCKMPRTPSSCGFIKAQKAEVDGSFHGLVFSKGSYFLEAECTFFDTISACQYAEFKDHDLEEPHGFYDSDEECDIVRLTHDRKPIGSLPDISASEPDTWWLGRVISEDDDWKQWYLVNYKENQILVGPTGIRAEWPDYFDFENVHLWSVDFLEECYYYEDSA